MRVERKLLWGCLGLLCVVIVQQIRIEGKIKDASVSSYGMFEAVTNFKADVTNWNTRYKDQADKIQESTEFLAEQLQKFDQNYNLKILEKW